MAARSQRDSRYGALVRLPQNMTVRKKIEKISITCEVTATRSSCRRAIPKYSKSIRRRDQAGACRSPRRVDVSQSVWSAQEAAVIPQYASYGRSSPARPIGHFVQVRSPHKSGTLRRSRTRRGHPTALRCR